MEAPEDDLLSRALQGDRRAIAALLKRHGQAARRSLAGRIPRRWQSLLSEDDVLQQTYADAAESIAQFDSKHESSFGKWLATIASRNLQDALRMLDAEKRGGGRHRIDMVANDGSWIALFELLGSSVGTPSAHVAGKEAVAALKMAMQRLPEAYAQVLQLHDLEGQPLQTVCATLKRTPGATLMLRQRALRRLHEIMGTTSKYFNTS